MKAHPENFTYTSDVFETAATSWIRNQTTAEKAKPFFAYVAYTTPHAGDWGTTKETGNPVYVRGTVIPRVSILLPVELIPQCILIKTHCPISVSARVPIPHLC